MARLPTLLLAGCAVCAGLTLTEFGFNDKRAPAIETRLPPAAVKPAAPDVSRLVDRSAHDAGSSLRDVRLTGVVIGPDLRIAIFAVAGANPLVLSEGEALKDWRLDRISLEKVVLSGPEGIIALAPKPDANLVRQPAPDAGRSDQLEPSLPPAAVMAGAPGPPLVATPIAVGNLPAAIPVPVHGYPYYSPPTYYAGYGQYYPSYDYYPFPYFYPYFAYIFPRRVGFGLGFFHHHGIHRGGFHTVAFHGGGHTRHR
jgi:hypothetical protein